MNKLVQVYWNSTKKLFSVRDPNSNRVIDHRSYIALVDAQFRVNTRGRQRVRRNKRKEVHATIVGTHVGYYPDSPGMPVRYNPYENDWFVNPHNEPVFFGDNVFLFKVDDTPVIRVWELQNEAQY